MGRLPGETIQLRVVPSVDPAIDRMVAIKVVRPDLATGSGSDQWLQRFRREARAAGRRFHPNIIAILDFGEDHGMPFLAMEYVEGSSLDSFLKASGPLDASRGVAIITQVLSALGFAHQNGIIHRDVKPSNIMILNSGEVKVADFCIARIDASEFTIVGDLLGTPAYMAPEQFSGAPVDTRTDLFAAGVILFEMLTGVKPFRGKSITEIMSLMENRGPEDIRTLNPSVPDSLQRRGRGDPPPHAHACHRRVRPGQAGERESRSGACRFERPKFWDLSPRRGRAARPVSNRKA